MENVSGINGGSHLAENIVVLKVSNAKFRTVILTEDLSLEGSYILRRWTVQPCVGILKTCIHMLMIGY